jgi:hypothetical protein
MRGRNQYIGADEVQALIGKWQTISGADNMVDLIGASYQPYPAYSQRQYAYSNPYAAQPAQARYAHHPHYRRYAHGHGRYPHNPSPYNQHQAFPYWPNALRDHRRADLQHRAYVMGDPVALGALEILGAEDAAAAAAAAHNPPDAQVIDVGPPPPLPPAPPPIVAPPPPPMPPPSMPPLPPPPMPMPFDGTLAPTGHHDHHRRQHGHHGHRGRYGNHGHAGYGGPYYPVQVYPTSPYPVRYDGGYPGPTPYASQGRPELVERQGSLRADRITLPMSSGVAILPNTSAQITSRPQNVAFRPERIIIGGRPGDWIVNDIKVGNRSQFSQSGDVPGEMFAATTIDAYVSMETVQTAMDFVMLVTFIGDVQGGAQFVCGVLGTAAV